MFNIEEICWQNPTIVKDSRIVLKVEWGAPLSIPNWFFAIGWSLCSTTANNCILAAAQHAHRCPESVSGPQKFFISPSDFCYCKRVQLLLGSRIIIISRHFSLLVALELCARVVVNFATAAATEETEKKGATHNKLIDYFVSLFSNISATRSTAAGWCVLPASLVRLHHQHFFFSLLAIFLFALHAYLRRPLECLLLRSESIFLLFI